MLSYSIAVDFAIIPRNWQHFSLDTSIENRVKSTAKRSEQFAQAVSIKYAELFNNLVHGELYAR